MSPSANAIERRLTIVEGHWNEFAENPDARLLRWLGKPEDLTLVDAFVELQFEEAGTSPDLFLKLETPFSEPEQYGYELAQAFVDLFVDVRPMLEEEKIDAGWRPPDPKTAESGHRALAWVCVSFHRHYQSLMERLAIYLAPSSVSDPALFEKWLYRLVTGNIPEAIRFLVVDPTDAMTKLAEKESTKVVSVPLDLNMGAALVELAKGESNEFGPDAKLRRHMVGLSNAAGKHDLPGAEKECHAAIAVCKEQGWPHLGTTLLMMLGSAYLGADRPDLARETYSRCVRAAEAAGKQGRPEAPSLLLQARLAEGACLVKLNEYAEAKGSYLAAAPLGEEIPDWFAAYESWRMVAVCEQTLGQNDAAWPAAGKAFQAAENIEAETRRHSTLPYFGRDLMTLAGDDKSWSDKVNAKMNKLVGEDWRDLIK